MTQERPTLVVACALLKRSGLGSGTEVMLARRLGEPVDLAGLWEFPGGKVEAGEQPHHALRRELREELGVVVMEPRLVGFQPVVAGGRSRLLAFFAAERWVGDPKANGSDHSELRWFQDREVLGQNLVPSVRGFLEAPAWRGCALSWSPMSDLVAMGAERQ